MWNAPISESDYQEGYDCGYAEYPLNIFHKGKSDSWRQGYFDGQKDAHTNILST